MVNFPYKDQEAAKAAVKNGDIIMFTMRPTAQEMADMILSGYKKMQPVISAEGTLVSTEEPSTVYVAWELCGSLNIQSIH